MNPEEERSVKDPCLRIIKVKEEIELLNGRNRCVVSLSVLQFWAYKLSKTGEQKVIHEKDSMPNLCHILKSFCIRIIRVKFLVSK